MLACIHGNFFWHGMIPKYGYNKARNLQYRTQLPWKNYELGILLAHLQTIGSLEHLIGIQKSYIDRTNSSRKSAVFLSIIQ